MDTIIENEMKAETNLDSQALLGISNFSAGYDASLILKNVDMVVPRNQVVALLGRNGVGKTTLLNSILGLVPSSGGSMTFDGRASRFGSLHETPRSRKRSTFHAHLRRTR